MANLNITKISKETWSLMKQEERTEMKAGGNLFRPILYINPIVHAVPHLLEKLSGVADMVREIGEFSSNIVDRDHAAASIQSWWWEYSYYKYFKVDFEDDYYDPWRSYMEMLDLTA